MIVLNSKKASIFSVSFLLFLTLVAPPVPYSEKILIHKDLGEDDKLRKWEISISDIEINN